MENNGRGIFYGVIGVATLVVAIIGATFAYFSATAGSADNTIQASGATVGLTWDENDDKVLTDLIPIAVTYAGDEDIENQLAEFITEVKTGDCKDDHYNVCSVYSFKVTNTGSVAQAVAPTLEVQSYGFDKKISSTDQDPVADATDNFRLAIFAGGMSTIDEATDFKTVVSLCSNAL